MSWRRSLLLTAAAIGAVGVVALILLAIRLDAVLQRTIEERGAALTGTAVRAEAVEVGLASGQARLRGLTVANPPGFATPNALALAEVEIAVDVFSLFSEPLVIDTIRVIAPQVFYEVNAAGVANIDVIRKHVEAQRKATRRPPDVTPGTPGPAARRPRRDRGGRRMIIHLLELREGEVTIDASAAGGKTRTEQLPPFELTAIGARQGGAAPPEVGRIILVALARNVAVAVAADELEKIVGKHLGGLLGDVIKKGGAGAIGQGLGGVLDQIFQKRDRPTPAAAE